MDDPKGKRPGLILDAELVGRTRIWRVRSGLLDTGPTALISKDTADDRRHPRDQAQFPAAPVKAWLRFRPACPLASALEHLGRIQRWSASSFLAQVDTALHIARASPPR